METRGRKREDKIRVVVALGVDLIEELKEYAKQSGKNVSVFLEELLAQKEKNVYASSGWNRHERKKICFRLPEDAIKYINNTTKNDKVSKESLIEAKLRQYVISPKPMLEKTAPIAIQYITNGDNQDEFAKAFKDLCVAFGTESNDRERTKDHRNLVAQKLAIRCIWALTDSQLLRLDKVLENLCDNDFNFVETV